MRPVHVIPRALIALILPSQSANHEASQVFSPDFWLGAGIFLNDFPLNTVILCCYCGDQF